MLLTTLVVSLPAIFNVGSLLLLLFFVYAYMGEPDWPVGGWPRNWRGRKQQGMERQRSCPCFSCRGRLQSANPCSMRAGMLLLGNIALQDNLNPQANFRTFPSAMLLLFRIAVGDDWVGIMQVGGWLCHGSRSCWHAAKQAACAVKQVWLDAIMISCGLRMALCVAAAGLHGPAARLRPCPG